MPGIGGNYTTSSFSKNGQYFALLSLDGRLRIWDTLSGKVIQEFSSNSAAQASCTCLCWTRSVFNKKGRKKLKRKLKVSGNENNIPFLSTLALGTEKGLMFCYNPTSGEVEVPQSEGHSAKINCVVYCEKSDVLYSCSDDKHIIEWCMGKSEIKTKWKADDQAVMQLCVSPSGKSILSAGCSIKLWNRDTKDLLQVFHGHASPISFLMFSPFLAQVNDKDDDGLYFVSGSTSERIINAWVINSKNPEKMAVTSFLISDNPSFVDTAIDENENTPLKLSVGCEDGRIHFFTFSLNGKTSKPIECSKYVDCVTKGSVKKPVPFINGTLQKDGDVRLTLVSGQEIKPEFSTLSYSSLDESSVIEKDSSQNLLLTKLKANNEKSIELVDTTSCSKIITDAVIAPIPFAIKTVKDVNETPAEDVKTETVDIKRLEVNDEELSLGERMKLQEADAKDFVAKMKPTKETPNAGSFAQLLIQALHSKDEKMISDILYTKSIKPYVLLNTIKRIPNNLIELLLKTLSQELLWNPNRSSSLITWIKTVITVHLTFILTNEACRVALSGLYRYVKSLEETHLPLLNLQGKIDLLYSFVTEDDEEEDYSTPAVVYNDDSDDENEEIWQSGEKDPEDTEESKMTTDMGTSEDDELRTGTEKNSDSLEDLEEDPPLDQSETDNEEE